MVELVWDGKYDEAGQRVEPVYPGRRLKTLEKHGDGDWHHRLILGDRKAVLPSLLPTFAGKVGLIYLDPPFATGGDFMVDGVLAYEDRWATIDQYLVWLYETLVLARGLLHETGSLYLHLAHHAGHYGRALLDEVFGQDCFQNEIIWSYRTGGASRRRFARKHDNIFFYTRSPTTWIFQVQKERSYMLHRYGFRKSDFQLDPETGQQYSLVYARDVWEIPSVGSATSERVGYPTQKPERLLERIISASSRPGDLVLDCFCGSGTTGIVAGKLDRRWIMSDMSATAVETTRQRLLNIAQPFVRQLVEDS